MSKIIMWRFSTPLGGMVTCATSDGICLLEFENSLRVERECADLKNLLDADMQLGENNYTAQCEQELIEYFSKTRQQFTVPLHTPGTPFQQKVWAQLQTIPFGQTRSYGEQARHIGQPTAARAVARANGSNRVAIIIPCHRVIGQNGQLVGYAGGLQRKERLLIHEGALQKHYEQSLFA